MTLMARWSGLSTLICTRRKVSLTTESNVLVWHRKCTRHSVILTLDVDVQQLPVLALKVTSVAYRNCSDRTVSLVTDINSAQTYSDHQPARGGGEANPECCNWHENTGFTNPRMKSRSSFAPRLYLWCVNITVKPFNGTALSDWSDGQFFIGCI